MQKLIIFIILFCGLLTSAIYSQGLRNHQNEAFKKGEKLKYRVYYDSFLTGQLTAGEATIHITKENKKFNNRSTFHIIGAGKSKGAFNWFYNVNDRFESYVDEDAFVPYLFIRRTHEGGYIKDDDVYFNHEKGIATSRTAVKNVPENIQDFLSALFFARTLDISSVETGSTFNIDFFLDDSVYVSAIKYLGKEIVETELGKFNCLKFAPMMATGNVFADKYPMFVWVTDDKNHLPVFAEAAVIVGSVKMELIKYSGLKNPMTSRIE